MIVSSNLIATLKKREALRLTAYADQGGVWTIGYGATTYESGALVKQGDTINQARAEQLLNFHVGVAAAGVNKYVKKPLTQGQFDALVSFAYNVGVTDFANSTLLKVVNTDPNNFKAVQEQLYRWVYVKGVKSNGLVNRRKEEYNMYTSNGSLSPVNFIWLLLIGAFIYFFRK